MMAIHLLDPMQPSAFRKIFTRRQDVLPKFLNDMLALERYKKVKKIWIDSLDSVLLEGVRNSMELRCQTEDQKFIKICLQVGNISKGELGDLTSHFLSKLLSSKNAKKELRTEMLHCVIVITSQKISSADSYLNRGILDSGEESYGSGLIDINLITVELSKFPFHQFKELKCEVDWWTYYFKFATKTTFLEMEKMKTHPTIKKAFALLRWFEWSEEEKEVYDSGVAKQKAIKKSCEIAMYKGFKIMIRALRSKRVIYQEIFEILKKEREFQFLDYKTFRKLAFEVLWEDSQKEGCTEAVFNRMKDDLLSQDLSETPGEV